MNPTHPHTQAGIQPVINPSAARPHVQPRERQGQFAITIGKLPEEIYSLWRDFRNLPRFMKDLESVEILDECRSRWTVRLKSGQSATWEAELTQDIPNRQIAWKSVGGSEVETKGSIWFTPAPANLGTIVEVAMDYRVPGGKLTEFITMFKGEDPHHLTLTNLKRLKALLETGEIATTEGQPSGRTEEGATSKQIH